jgi:hypothetical protein
MIGSHLLSLSNETTDCELITEIDNTKTQLTLPLSAPCYWITKPESTDAQHYSYPNESADQVALIAGTALNWSDEKKEYQKLPLDVYCSQYIQGIAIKSDSSTLIGEKLDAPNCIGQAIDEKVFHGLALQQNTVIKTTEKPKDENEKGLFESIKKTFKQLFSSEDDAPKDG